MKNRKQIVKFGDPWLNRCRETRPKAITGGIFAIIGLILGQTIPRVVRAAHLIISDQINNVTVRSSLKGSQ